MEREELKLILRESLLEAFEEHHICRYNINPSDIQHLVTLYTDLGDGNFGKGIETARTNHKWFARWSIRIERLAEVIVKTVAIALIGAILTAIWIGIKARIIGGT